MTDVVMMFCTLIFTMALITTFVCRKELQKGQSYTFLSILVCICVCAGCSLVSNYIEDSYIATGTLFIIQYATQLILFLAHNLLAALLAFYVMLVNGVALYSKKKWAALFLAPLTVAELLVITNPFTRFIFYYSDSKDYYRGPLAFINYVVAGIYLIIAIYEMIKYRKVVTRETNIVLWFFFSFSFVGILIQLLIPDLKVELFAEAVSALGIMLTIEEERDLVDSSSKMYNRNAFVYDNRRLIETKQSYSGIVVTITNIRLFVNIMNYATMSDIVLNITMWLRHIERHVYLYRIATGNFALIYLDGDRMQAEKVVKRIRDRFEDGWDYKGTRLDFNVSIRLAMVPEDTASPMSLLDIAEDKGDTSLSGVTVSSAEEVKSIIMMGAIENAIRRAIKNDLFEVYYQPIWSVERSRFCTAEALLRLNDPLLGQIPPDQFIPIAERSGLIGDIGQIVFEKVCQFVARKDVRVLALDYIEINMSLYQLIVGNTPERFRQTLMKYHVQPSQINLEITETVGIDGRDTIVRAVEELRSVGFDFSLDDFGTGYANMSNLVALRFRNVKSDKGLLWDSSADEMSKSVLCSYITIIRGLGINVIQEGVETREQLDLVVAAGANYIQGFYFSRPVPGDSFISFIAKFNNSLNQ